MNLASIMFNTKKPFAPIRISGGTTNGRISSQCEKLLEQRLEASEKEMLEDDVKTMRHNLNENIKQTTTENLNIPGNHNDEIYKKYNFDNKTQSATQLPVYASKKKILSTIAEYKSIVIEGSTGCGKSTQVPQMILDDAREHGRPCNIVVTQPRRIAARSIADQVCRERKWGLGTLVGYQIGLDRENMSDDTRILYCTTGVLLEKLVQSKTLSQFTHIVLDEVHERDKDMDFLFIIIRMLMGREHSNVRIVLMSATIDTAKFAEYFRIFHLNEWIPAPVVRIDKSASYFVQEVYLDDFDKALIPDVSYEHPGISEDMFRLTFRLIKNLDKQTPKSRSILIFLPGIFEIGRLHTLLSEFAEQKKAAWKIFILHSLISTEEQQSIFQNVEDARKIILSTNIAESSITVPDVYFVIDFCLMKYLKSDSLRNCTRLEMDWASKSHCRQRLGRAGRVMDGRCYRMVTRRFYEYYLRSSAVPELLLAPLENVVLKAKTFQMAPPHVILGLAMDSPKMDDVANTILTLKELGAMQLMVKDEGYSAIDGELTYLGRVMAGLPIDVRCTRLIAIGYCYGVLPECIIMAAGLTSKSIFKISFEKSLREYSRRLEWSNGSGSDLFAILNAYQVWTMKHNQREFGDSREQRRRGESEFCHNHCLDVRSMNECHQLVLELTQRLDKLGIREDQAVDKVRWSEQEKAIILKVVIAGAFYPNFFATLPINNPMIERDIFRTMNGRDPDNTVFFTGFRKDNIRQLYVQQIQNLFRNTVVHEDDIGCVKVSFDKDSEKAFVTFDVSQSCNNQTQPDWDTRRCSIPGKTLTEVYKAVKMRKMRIPATISVMTPDNERYFAEKHGLGVMTGSTFQLKEFIRDDLQKICIPRVANNEVIGRVTHVEHCSKFWFQPEREKALVNEYYRQLNQGKNDIIEQCTDYLVFNRSTIIVARDHRDQKLYRARLTEFECDAQNKFKGTVCFIDFGHTQKCELEDIYIFTRAVEQFKMPPRSFQCRLAEIQPSTSNISGGFMWDREAIDLFCQHTANNDVMAEVYSVVNGTVNIYIETVNRKKLNDLLVEEGFAEFCEENFLSKSNRWKRQNYQSHMNREDAELSSLEVNDCDEYYPIDDVEPIQTLEQNRCHRAITLVGPKSPLESEMYSTLVNSSKRSIIIDAHSVNSVLLTPLQQDLSIKYMVAAHISQKGLENSEGTAHETTLLPSIRGFGPLMAMVFCPTMDLKRDEWKSRYISVRTGLGYNEDKKCPYFPEHDLVFPLDFQFTDADLSLINQMRYSFDTLLFAIGNKTPSDAISMSNKLTVMKKLQEVTLKLLTVKRPAIEINPVNGHEWREYYPEEYKKFDNVYAEKAIFPVHGLLDLKPQLDKETKRRLRTHCEDLRNMATMMSRPVTCVLCKIEIENVAVLRTHLMSRLHQDREKQVGFMFNKLNIK